jgi:hypothetical protein
MTSPFLPWFHLAGLPVVSRRNLGPVRLSISYRLSSTPTIRVPLIFQVEIPYFFGAKRMEGREEKAILLGWPGARS